MSGLKKLSKENAKMDGVCYTCLQELPTAREEVAGGTCVGDAGGVGSPSSLHAAGPLPGGEWHVTKARGTEELCNY